MGISTEALLALLIVALYLKDSLLPLRSDEAVLVRGLGGQGGRWHAGFGARGYKLAGREPWLANPFTPHAPVFRLGWAMRAAGSAGAPPSSSLPQSLPLSLPLSLPPTALLSVPPPLAWLAPFAWVSWGLLFVAIPTAVVAQWGVLAVLSAVGLLYLNIVAALAVTWAQRGPLGLSGRALAMLAFECLVCAPYSANLVRRLSLLSPSAEDFTAAASRLLPPDALAEVHRECLARIDEQIEAEPEDSAAARALQQARQRFATPGEAQ